METILVHEMDTATLKVVGMALQMEGYKVVSSQPNQSENVLDLIRYHHAKLVLLDCWLARHSGKQLLHWIKSHFPKLPVIAFSCDNLIVEQYRQLGFDDYLTKPFNLQDLYHLVKKYCPQKAVKPIY